MNFRLTKRFVEKKLGTRIDNIKEKKTGVGEDHSIFFLGTAKGEFVLKVPIKTDWKTKLIGESFAFEKWSGLGVPVPKVFGVDFKHRFIIEQKIGGSKLADMKLNNRKIHDVLYSIGKSLRIMHTVKTKRWGEFRERGGVGYLGKWSDYVDGYFRWKFGDLERTKKVDGRLLTQAKNAYEEGMKFVIGFDSPKLLHGDLHRDNIFINNSGMLSGILDAADCLSGDPMYDLAFLYALKYIDGIDVSGLLDGYGKHDIHRIKLYCVGMLVGRLRRSAESGRRIARKNTARSLKMLLNDI